MDARGAAAHVELTTGTANKYGPALSPDGTALAFMQESDAGWDLFRVPTAGGPPKQLTFGGAVSPVAPAWDPTGRWLAFATGGATRRVGVVAATGGPPRIFKHTQVSQEIAWSPAHRIAYQVLGNRNFRLVDPESEAEERLVQNDSVGWMFGPRFSPDGTQVAVCWNRKDRPGLWLISRSDGSQKRLNEHDIYPPEWSGDARNLYVSVDNVYLRLPISGGPGEAVPAPKLADASCVPYERASGLVWVCTQAKPESDVWMIKNFDPEYASRIRRKTPASSPTAGASTSR